MYRNSIESLLASVGDYGFTPLKGKESCVFEDSLHKFSPETVEESLKSLVRQGKPKTLKLPDILAECRAIEPESAGVKDSDRRFIRAPDSYRKKMQEMRGTPEPKRQPSPERTAAAIYANTAHALNSMAKQQGRSAPEPREIIAMAVRFVENAHDAHQEKIQENEEAGRFNKPAPHDPLHIMTDSRYAEIIADLRSEWAKYPGQEKSTVPTVEEVAATAKAAAPTLKKEKFADKYIPGEVTPYKLIQQR